MEGNAFKTALFGGFLKEDVIRYIEKISQESAEKLQELQTDNDLLHAANQTQSDQLTALQRQVDALTEENGRLAGEAEQSSASREEAEALRAENAQLREELDKLRPQAKAYQEFKLRIGDIECEAHRRADDLEAATTARLNQLLSACRAQYEDLVSTFDVTSNHVTGELRKVEVNLSQLPRAMDQVGANIAELEKQLHRGKAENKQ